MAEPSPGLARELSLTGLVATALCAMVGVGINIIPFMVQRSKPGVGDAVPLAYLLAAIPATLAALCYATLASGMPRAGGSYVYVTRALDPVLGFVASFAQWFGLTMGMGVVAYLVVPVLRDIVATLGGGVWAPLFDRASLRLPIALVSIWLFWWINVAGVKRYERTVVVMAAAMIVGPIVMTAVGFAHDHADFGRALGPAVPTGAAAPLAPPFSLTAFFGTVAVLFSSFIGFDAIAQAGGEARDAERTLPRSIVIAMTVVVLYYIVFTAAVYHAVPWEHMYAESLVRDLSAPGLLAPLMPAWLAAVILVAVAMAILNSIPSVMLANSRLLYAFGADHLFPAFVTALHPRHRTPHHALTLTAAAASFSVVGCHVAGSFFLGVDLLLLSMLVNFWLVACSVLALPRVNPALHRRVRFLGSRAAQAAVAGVAVLVLGLLLTVQVGGDLGSAQPWYLKSVTAWLVAMSIGGLVFRRSWRQLAARGIDPRAPFGTLPAE